MAPLYPIQPTFARGEISPRLWSRADISHWKMSLKECLNFIVLKHGGARKRPGTEFIAEVKDSSVRTMLRRFVFSIEQAYILEFGPLYIRFYANGGAVEDPPGTPIEIATPYEEAELFDLQFAQSADILYIAHPNHPPMELHREDATTFELVEHPYEDGPYRPRNTTQTLLFPDDTSGDVIVRSVKDHIPKMTDATTEGVTMTMIANTAEEGREIWKMADKDQTSWFQTNSGQSFTAQIDFGAGNPKEITYYQVVAVNSESDPGEEAVYRKTPSAWTLQGSNDGVGFFTIDTISGQTWASGKGQTYEVASPDSYRYYRWAPTANQDSSGASRVAEFNLLIETTDGVNGDDGFSTDDIERHINLEYGDENYWGIITGINSTTEIEVTFEEAVPSTGATGGWRLGAWGEGVGFPGCVAFYKQRLVWGRSNLEPQTVWFSRAGVFEEYGFNTTSADDDAITLTILSGEVNAIQWLVEGKDLQIGTTGSCRTIGPGDRAQPFSATNLDQQRHSTFGSQKLQPVQVGNVTLYPSFYGKSLREFLFSFQIDAYVSPELSILGEHMLRSGIVQMDYAQHEESIVWIAVGNGELVGLTYERDQEMVSLHRHRIGGRFDGQDEDDEYGIVESVQCIPGEDATELWLIVKRTIDGDTVRYVERMTFPFEDAEVEDAFFVDSGFRYDGVLEDEFTGIDWLPGEEIAILADGRVEVNKTVSAAGEFTISGEAAKVNFGLPYLSQMQTLPIVQGYGDGSTLGRKKRVVQVIVDLMETGYLQVAGPRKTSFEEVFGRTADDLFATKVELRDGTYSTRPDSSWKDAGEVVMRSDKPLPATIRSITPAFEGET